MKTTEYLRGRREAFRDIGMHLAKLADEEQRCVKEAITEIRKYKFGTDEYKHWRKIESAAMERKIGYMKSMLAIDELEKEPIE